MEVAQKVLGQAYCILILGIGIDEQHHMACGRYMYSIYGTKFDLNKTNLHIGRCQLYKYRIKYEFSPLIKILYSFEAQPRQLYNVLINGVDRAL